MSDLFDYDAELRRYNEHFRAAARVGVGDRVLDVGCGTGQSTREAARAAVTGSAVGVDVSAPMLERARQLSAEQGLNNVTYLQADAQVHRFAATSSTSVSAGSERCSLLIQLPHSPISGALCAPARAWCS